MKGDLKLLQVLSQAYFNQNQLYRLCLHVPIAWPCFLFGSVCSCLTQADSYNKFHNSKLDQSHRIHECVCCFTVMSYTLDHDAFYAYPEVSSYVSLPLPQITVINNNTNSIGDINNSSNNSSSNNSTAVSTVPVENPLLSIKQKRLEKAIREERLSDAEVIAKEITELKAVKY